MWKNLPSQVDYVIAIIRPIARLSLVECYYEVQGFVKYNVKGYARIIQVNRNSVIMKNIVVYRPMIKGLVDARPVNPFHVFYYQRSQLRRWCWPWWIWWWDEVKHTSNSGPLVSNRRPRSVYIPFTTFHITCCVYECRYISHRLSRKPQAGTLKWVQPNSLGVVEQKQAIRMLIRSEFSLLNMVRR